MRWNPSACDESAAAKDLESSTSHAMPGKRHGHDVDEDKLRPSPKVRTEVQEVEQIDANDCQ